MILSCSYVLSFFFLFIPVVCGHIYILLLLTPLSILPFFFCIFPYLPSINQSIKNLPRKLKSIFVLLPARDEMDAYLLVYVLRYTINRSITVNKPTAWREQEEEKSRKVYVVIRLLFYLLLLQWYIKSFFFILASIIISSHSSERKELVVDRQGEAIPI